MNVFKFSKIKYFILVSLLLLCFIFISAVSYVNAINTDISNAVFRLHIIANSNSKEDQNLKYRVRDEIIKYLDSISKDCSSKEEILNLVNLHKNDFYEVAKNTISSSGFNYAVNINIGNYEFPTKKYGDIELPSGKYDALKIEIGNASGKNWWCVMFPPLCFIDVTSRYCTR